MLIRPTSIHDAQLISQMRRDPEVYNNIHDPRLYPEHQTAEWIKNLPSSSMRFTIEVGHQIYPVFVGLFRIDHLDYLNQTCYVGLDICKDFRGKGLSKQICNEMLSYLFNKLNMQIIYLEVLDTNHRACSLYAKFGFKPTGRFPGKILRDGKRIDSIIMCWS